MIFTKVQAKHWANRLVIALTIGATISLGIHLIPIRGVEVLTLDIKQRISNERAPSTDFVVVNLPTRRLGVNPEEYFLVDRVAIIKALEDISRYSPRAIVLFEESLTWRDNVTSKAMADFAAELSKIPKLFLYRDNGERHIGSIKFFRELLPVIDHWDRTSDLMKPPGDRKSRYINLRVHDSGFVSNLITFLNDHGHSIAPTDFKYSFDHMGTTQIMIKYFAPGSFDEDFGVSETERYQDKLILVGFADSMNGSIANTPIESKSESGSSNSTLQRGALWDQEYIANLFTNLSERRYVKTLPERWSTAYLFSVTFVLALVLLNISNVKTSLFAFIWILTVNAVPFLAYHFGDMFLFSIPTLISSIITPYLVLPFILYRSQKNAAIAKISAEQSIQQLKQEGIVVSRSAQADASFRIAVRLAHDIRGPLSALNIALRSLEGSAKPKALAVKSIDRLTTIADSLLATHRMGDQFGSKQRVHFDLVSLVEDLASYVNTVAPEIEVVKSIAIERAISTFAKDELERHLINLINNAIESLRSTNTLQPKIVIELAQLESNYKIGIFDNGPGIPKEISERIFVRGTTFGKVNGNGIGLSSAKEFLSGIGGSISINTTNEGCRVEVSIPSNKNQFEISVRGRVIVVDDDSDVLEMFSKQLEDYEPKLITSDPSTAIDYLNKYRGPMTVISDLIFPNSQVVGFDILRAAPSNSTKYLFTTLGSENSVLSLAAKSNISVIDKATIPKLRID
ncbi:MAG: HAMP domain-containing histidine kinase [Bdellovibrionaceae bacterium]|nr:HAMP domain-containing histidine kinase [Pseudobdellovibrionaceae bacterium]